jgi:6-phosphogluconolactonase
MIPLNCLYKCGTPEHWLQTLERDFVQLVDQATLERGVCHISLSGGNTPKPFYRHLNQAIIPWENMEWWAGDERCVHPTDPQSNEKMIYDTLFAPTDAGVQPPYRFHTWYTGSTWQDCAANYHRRMTEILGQPAVFDLILLGLGNDGHTASLFPSSPALEETAQNAVYNPVVLLNTERLTITYPVLKAAREIWFLISGEDKGPMVERLLEGDSSIPAGNIDNPNQKVYWLI